MTVLHVPELVPEDRLALIGRVMSEVHTVIGKDGSGDAALEFLPEKRPQSIAEWRAHLPEPVTDQEPPGAPPSAQMRTEPIAPPTPPIRPEPEHAPEVEPAPAESGWLES